MTSEETWRHTIRLAPRFEPRDARALTSRIRAALDSAGVEGEYPPGQLAQDVARMARGPVMVRRSIAVSAWITAVAAMLLCGSLTLWMWALSRQAATTDVDLVARDVVASHIRSLMAQHLTDVPSSDRHTVKPWFAGKVPYAITVPDFKTQGFALEGGRLDYASGRVVAALVYRRRQHVINVFVWPLTPADQPQNGARAQAGYDAIAWTAHGQQHWAVSDVNAADLQELASLFQHEE